MSKVLADNLRAFRKERGNLSQSSLAAESGISLRTIQDIEAAAASTTVATLEALSLTLKIPAGALLTENREALKVVPTPDQALEILREAIRRPIHSLPDDISAEKQQLIDGILRSSDAKVKHLSKLIGSALRGPLDESKVRKSRQ